MSRHVTAGAEPVVLCTNTMRKVADQIGDAIDVPVVHIADTTADVRARRLDLERRAARDRLHDGAIVLRRSAPRPARTDGAHTRRARPRGDARRDLLRTSANAQRVCSSQESGLDRRRWEPSGGAVMVPLEAGAELVGGPFARYLRALR